MSPDDLLVVYAFAAWVLILAVVALWSDTRHEPPQRHPRNRPTCQAARCGLPAYWLDTHTDGPPMWTCPGHHDTGQRAGWLRPERTPTRVVTTTTTQGDSRMSTIAPTRTIADMTAATGVVVTTGHDHDLGIPVLTGMQRQGDVLVIPSPRGKTATTPVPATGTPVVRGESGGNTHAIYPDGPGVTCDAFAADGGALRVATLTVPAGSTAYLGHPEHAFMGIGPGRYELRRQREMADELRVVAD